MSVRLSHRARRKLRLVPEEVIIGGIYKARIGGAWCYVRVVGDRGPTVDRRFDVVRHPPASNCLRARTIGELRRWSR